jgi:BCD family chlorophyll transporter-like MFS transporter
MADILLEPFGGQVLNMSVASTTRLTALLALGGLLGFVSASRTLGRGTDPFRLAGQGAMIGVPAFLLVMVAAPLGLSELFLLGNFLIGFGGAFFAHGTLTATMNAAPAAQAGLALGAWGAVQATAAGLGTAFSGTLRDLIDAFLGGAEAVAGLTSAANGYLAVYGIEILLLLVAIVATWPLIRAARGASARGVSAPVPSPGNPAS